MCFAGGWRIWNRGLAYGLRNDRQAMNINEQSVFAEALEIQDPQAKTAFLDRVCAGNPGLRKDVESLLSAYGAGEFLESPISVPTVEPLATSDRPGTIIGHYKLLEQIGEGGFGVVF